MTVEVDLVRNNRVVVVTYSGRMNEEDVNTVVNFITNLLEHAERPVHNLSDISQVTTLPPNLIVSLRSFYEMFHHPMFGTVSLVTARSSLFFDAIANAFVRGLPSVQVHIFKSQADAWAAIDRVVQTEQ